VRLVPSNELEGDVVLQLHNPVDGSEETVIAQPSEQPGHYTFELTFSHPGAWAITVKPGWFPESQLSALVVGEVATEPVEIDNAMEEGRWERWMRRGLAWAGSIVNTILARNSSPSQAAVADSSIATGRVLFSAKGCVTCHIHADVTTVWTTESGPNLTHYQADSEWLAQWLTEPTSVRPAAQMPNLALSPDEIVALRAFLLAE
jgi:mono/diheme cytochrome c family protein